MSCTAQGTARPWDSIRLCRVFLFGAVSVFLWPSLHSVLVRDILRSISGGQLTLGLLAQCVAALVGTCAHAAAIGIAVQAAAGASWSFLAGYSEPNLVWFYVYAATPLFLGLISSSSTSYVPLFFFHCELGAGNVGTMLGLPVSRMLRGWMVLTPVYVFCDWNTWRSASAAAGSLQGPPVWIAALRGCGLAVGGLASMLLLQLAFGPTMCKEKVLERTDAVQQQQQQQQQLHDGPDYRGLPAPCSLCAKVDRAYYLYGSALLRAVPLGVLVCVTCLPYVACMACLALYRISGGDVAGGAGGFEPAHIALCLLAAFLLGRTDLQDVLRRMAATEDVLHDLVPEHIADALLLASVPQPASPGPSASAAAFRSSAQTSWLTSGTVTPSFRNHSIDFTSGGPAPHARPPRGLAHGEAPADLHLFQQQLAEAVAKGVAVKAPQSAVHNTGSLTTRSDAIAPEWHEGVTVVFADIKGFTEMAQCVEPWEVMQYLNRLYHRFDSLTRTMPGIYKVETIGDCYMGASGLIQPDPDHASAMLRFAAAILGEAGEVSMPHNGQPTQLRVGMSSGRVMSGVVGSIRRRYCIFGKHPHGTTGGPMTGRLLPAVLAGDVVNVSSRLETTSLPGRIHISECTYQLVQHLEGKGFEFEKREPIEVKGKGLMQTFFATPTAGH
ncbi:Guanylate cyclase soluble subunit beta-2 [Tetrabaena socialis]|uniref:Guanylate cyclase soluble subunit beta-2 n=1 Tax=Tetrabaena socialis TaxID=47790 RepID=A0A2J8AFB5_9CHLO|nr:Guanylate cyclase soluble subunit beta-2 [Tetrabaena socialis]|eukprot:PNH11204.1 Guanylate cyclase soluble subunit beta-2 [Tetrabaena socialis]